MPKVKNRSEAEEKRAEYRTKTESRNDLEVAKLAKKINRIMRRFKSQGLEYTQEYKQYEFLVKQYSNGKSLPETLGGVKKLSDFRLNNLKSYMEELDANRLNKKEYDAIKEQVKETYNVKNNADANKLLGDVTNNIKSQIWKLESYLSSLGYGTENIRDLVDKVDAKSAAEQGKLFINLVRATTEKERGKLIKDFNVAFNPRRPLISRKPKSKKMK